VGFSQMDAGKIATADQRVDASYSTGFGRAIYHFALGRQRAQIWDRYLATGNFEDLGMYLHMYQDQFSHSQHDALSHLLAGAEPDITAVHGEEAFQTASDTYEILRAEAEKLGLPPERIVPFEILEGAIWQFIDAISDTEKANAISRIRSIIDKYQEKHQ
jgi:hypothetical protein